MIALLCFSHGVVFVFDSNERAPGNAWTDGHAAQGFARRPTAANVGTLVEYGCATLEAASAEWMDRCERVVVLSLRSDSGSISVSGTDPADRVIWRGRPGWVRVTVGQVWRLDDLRLGIQLAVEEAEGEQPTCVRESGAWRAGPFIETAGSAG